MTPPDRRTPSTPPGRPGRLGRWKLVRVTVMVAWSVTVSAWRYRVPGAWGPVRLAWRNVAWVAVLGRLPVPV